MREYPNLDRIAAAFVKRNVNFLAIGGWALQSQGYDLGKETEDIDLTPDLSINNLDRLSVALYDLGALIRAGDERLPFNHSGESLSRAGVWNLTCEYGDFDLSFIPTGTRGYLELAISAETVTLSVDGMPVKVRCANPVDIIHSKVKADREKDRRVVPLLMSQLGADQISELEERQRTGLEELQGDDDKHRGPDIGP